MTDTPSCCIFQLAQRGDCPNHDTPEPDAGDVEELAKVIRPWTLCDDGGRFDHGSNRAASAVLASDWLAERVRVAVEQERAAWVAKIEALAAANAIRLGGRASYTGVGNNALRAFLPAEDTEQPGV